MPTPTEIKESIKDNLDKALNKTVKGAKAAGKAVGTGIEKAGEGAAYVKDAAQEAMPSTEGIKKGFRSAKKAVTPTEGGKFDNAVGTVASAASTVKDGIKDAMPSTKGIKKGFSSAKEAVTPTEGGKFDNAVGAVASAARSVKGGIKGSGKWFSNNFSQLKDYIGKKMQSGVDAASNSSVGSKVGDVVDGVKTKGKAVKQAGEEKLNQTAENIQQKANDFAESAEQKISPKWKDRFQNAADTLKDGASSFSRGMGKAVDAGKTVTAVPGKTIDWAQQKFNAGYNKADSSHSPTPPSTPAPTENKRNSLKKA